MTKDPIMQLYLLYADYLAKAKYQESMELAEREIEAIENISQGDDVDFRASFSDNIKSVDTAWAYGQLDGIRACIEHLEGKKFKYPNPNVRMNGKRLVAVNALLRSSMYSGFVAGKLEYYILEPGAKALAVEPNPSLDSPAWKWLNPNHNGR